MQKRPYPADGDTYGYIKFQTKQVDKIGIPYGERFLGDNTDGAPCTLNGFLGSENGEIIPEWKVTEGGGLKIEDGAELHMVVNGEDKIVAIFKNGYFQ